MLIQLVSCPDFYEAQNADDNQKEEDQPNYYHLEEDHQLLSLELIWVVLVHFLVEFCVGELAISKERK